MLCLKMLPKRKHDDTKGHRPDDDVQGVGIEQKSINDESK
jgi:hypothetical protein